MRAYFLRRIFWRILAGLGVLWGAATLTFLAIHLTEGDPAMTILGGPEALPTPAVIEQVRKEYRLDEPLYKQYFFYLGRIARGDLGESYRLRISVVTAIAQQLGSTLQLAASAGFFSVTASLLIALFTANRSPVIRRFFNSAEVATSSVPNFVVGIALLFAFAFWLRLLPASGQRDWNALILPVLTVSLPLIAKLSQVLRAQLEDVLEQPFIQAARSRGLSETSIRLRHALRHALIPVVTLFGFMFGTIVGGAVITETLFARRGIGRLMAEASSTKDVPLVVGITLLAAATYVTVNLVVDLLNAAIDPRQKLS